MVPIATTVAMLEPEIAAKNAHAQMPAITLPPLIGPNSMRMTLIKWPEILPFAAILPAMIKNGMPNSTKLFNPLNICSATSINDMSENATMPNTDEISTTNETGMPRIRSRKNDMTTIMKAPPSPSVSWIS